MPDTHSRPSAHRLAPSEPTNPLHVIIAHDDHDAYLRALRMLANTLYGHPEAHGLQPLPWRFDELNIEHWRRRALADAPRAEVFVVSASRPDALPPGVHRWLADCLGARGGRATAVLALCEERGGAEPCCRDDVRRIAQAAGADFIESGVPVLTGGR